MGENEEMYVCLDGGRKRDELRRRGREGRREEILISNHTRRRGSHGHAILKTPKKIARKKEESLHIFSLPLPFRSTC